MTAREDRVVKVKESQRAAELKKEHVFSTHVKRLKGRLKKLEKDPLEEIDQKILTREIGRTERS
jgi:hypothetical protein